MSKKSQVAALPKTSQRATFQSSFLFAKKFLLGLKLDYLNQCEMQTIMFQLKQKTHSCRKAGFHQNKVLLQVCSTERVLPATTYFHRIRTLILKINARNSKELKATIAKKLTESASNAMLSFAMIIPLHIHFFLL